MSSVSFRSFRGKGSHSLFLPPLLAWHSGDEEAGTETTFALNTYYQSRRTGFTLASVPLLFAGREGDVHHLLVPPLFWRWGDKERTTTIAANVFWTETAERFARFLEFLGGREGLVQRLRDEIAISAGGETFELRVRLGDGPRGGRGGGCSGRREAAAAAVAIGGRGLLRLGGGFGLRRRSGRHDWSGTGTIDGDHEGIFAQPGNLLSVSLKSLNCEHNQLGA